jgi:ribosomal-protein-alanine N-acetyltransferase
MNLDYRRMQSSDIKKVCEIERSLFADPWSAESFLHDIQKNEISYPFLVEANGNIIGYLVCWYYASEIHIGNIAVRKDYQGQGIGTYLLKKIFGMFQNYNIAYLEVRKNNITAIKLYKKFGFDQICQRISYYPDGEDAIIMVKFGEESNK